MRIAGVTIPEKKRLEVALRAVYGIGPSRARHILTQAKVSYDERAGNLTSTQENTIRELVGGYKTEGDLKREISGHIKRLKDVRSYRGDRHSRRLPVRGQRTRVNSRTSRGNVRRTMTSGKRKTEKK